MQKPVPVQTNEPLKVAGPATAVKAQPVPFHVAEFVVPLNGNAQSSSFTSHDMYKVHGRPFGAHDAHGPHKADDEEEAELQPGHPSEPLELLDDFDEKLDFEDEEPEPEPDDEEFDDEDNELDDFDFEDDEDDELDEDEDPEPDDDPEARGAPAAEPMALEDCCAEPVDEPDDVEPTEVWLGAEVLDVEADFDEDFEEDFDEEDDGDEELDPQHGQSV